jgi:hypothetical protein
VQQKEELEKSDSSFIFYSKDGIERGVDSIFFLPNWNTFPIYFVFLHRQKT